MLHRNTLRSLVAPILLITIAAFVLGMAAQRELSAVYATEVVVVDEDGEIAIRLFSGDDGGTIELTNRATGRILRINASSRRLQPKKIHDEQETASEEDLSGIRVRSGGSPSNEELLTAKRLIAAGWVYVMPRPKSAQARWGNSDGRTTWYNGYWQNRDNDRVSRSQPSPANGYKGDGQDDRGWRRGGSPRFPNIIEWMCSRSGGVEPR